MLALVASVLLGLYVFLPDFFFNKFAGSYADLKKYERTKVEEITGGIFVALIPFLVAWLLSSHLWFFGHWPFPVSENVSDKLADYRLVFAALYHEDFFIHHQEEVWRAVSHVKWHQLRFLSWNYLFLFAEIRLVRDLTANYWRWKNNWFYKRFIASWLLRRVSEWELLLTAFNFDPKERRSVIVDVMTSDSHLYSGTVASYFKDKDGSLSGILLKPVRRFQYSRLEEDRKSSKPLPIEQYWKPIPGANFYISAENIVTMNIIFPPPQQNLLALMQNLLGQRIVIRSDPSGGLRKK